MQIEFTDITFRAPNVVISFSTFHHTLLTQIQAISDATGLRPGDVKRMMVQQLLKELYETNLA